MEDTLLADDLWYEEDLLPPEAAIEPAVKSLVYSKGMSETEATEQVTDVKGIIRVGHPRWKVLDPKEHKLLTSAQDTRFYLVRLAFEFALADSRYRSTAHFVYARCSAYLWPAKSGEPQPKVYEVIPRDLYEGEPRKVNVEVGPEIKVGDVGGSLGKISTDFTVGMVEPTCVGFSGEEDRAPYWELHPQNKSLLGLRHFWVILETSAKGSGARLAVMAEGDVQAQLFRIPIGPRSTTWDSRQSVVIA